MKNIKAVALKYQQNQDLAPRVVAKGSGEIAEKIIQKAKEFDVAIFQNKELADSLMKVDVDDTIPESLYKAVVEVFVWLHKTEQKAQLSKD